ncbi:MAG: lipid A deacylase LpxR family protein [Reyranella sp.]|uniref:lipid A deacylase LpxR family protein n=1 Tax=Reyranella sp. TaxID=1929291 RepID=UPI00120E5197|nr:lipid A deacylase LpxR family protein [Reyranella sp.]TAJ37054.1 MAG: lipid A deacylase LpxR family protein [Reyranella sp.]
MEGKVATTIVLTMAALLANIPGLAAQTAPPRTSATEDEQRSIYTFQVENDVFNRLARTDRDYTSGLRVGWLSPALTEMLPGLVAATTVPTFFGEAAATSVIRRVAVSFGQNIYTPEDTYATQPIYNDRPYAAWLYGSVALQYTYKRPDPKTGTDEPVRLDTLQLDVGVIGPAAGGSFVQNNWHTLIGVSPTYGWANQLHNEPTLGLAFERRWRTGRSVLIEDPKLEFDFIPRIGAALGNVATYASAGGTARIGKNLRDDFGPTRARPALPGSEAFIGDGSFGWYLFAGLDAQVVGRNIFLDGNTDGDSLSVGHRPFVGEAQVGFALLYGGVRFTYTQVLRTPEFYQQDRFTQFGSVNLTFRY